MNLIIQLQYRCLQHTRVFLPNHCINVLLQFIIHGVNACCQWDPWAEAKKLSARVAVPPAPVRVPSQRLLSPNVRSVTNDEGINEMIRGTVHRSPGICLTAEENPGKSQLGDRLMKGLCDQSSSQMGPFPPNEVGRIAQHVRKGEGRKEGKDGN